MNVDQLVPPAEKHQMWNAFKDMRRQYRAMCNKEKKKQEAAMNEQLLSAQERGECVQFWTMVKQRRGFCGQSIETAVVADKDGEMKSGREAAEVWRDLYERVGNEQDDGDEKAQQANPFDAAWREKVEADLRRLVANPSTMPDLDSDITAKELDAAIGKLKRNVAAGP